MAEITNGTNTEYLTVYTNVREPRVTVERGNGILHPSITTIYSRMRAYQPGVGFVRWIRPTQSDPEGVIDIVVEAKYTK